MDLCRNVFATLPPVRSDQRGKPTANIGNLARGDSPTSKRRIRTLHDYVVFRLAHATWASDDEAQAMHDEGVEADVNLESNVATGAYPMARMPLGEPVDHRPKTSIRSSRIPSTNLALNDLLGTRSRIPSNRVQVGAILGSASLKFLLERNVRCLLGTDGAGVEHSDIVEEYEYAYA